jgi:hypothetical protein
MTTINQNQPVTMAISAWILGCLVAMAAGQPLQNGGFETLDHWSCYNGFTCTIVSDHHGGQHSVMVSDRFVCEIV